MGKKQGWLVGDVEPDSHRFYALVNFADQDGPVAYILPSAAIRQAAEEADRE